jgi:aminoglycoside phosphotransferase (APT) family kinase protein
MRRLTWTQLPVRVRTAVESAVDSTVIAAVDQTGGFSPGLAARVMLANGRKVFVKAVSAERNSSTPDMFRTEAAVLARLPENVPVPRLRFVYDDADWIALVIDDVDGRTPVLPWRPNELRRVWEAMTDLATELTPSPIDAPLVTDSCVDVFRGWRSLAADPDAPPLSDLGLTSRDQVARLAALETEWPSVAIGDSLLHGDLRADNILLTDERVMFVDWPHAAVGPAWLDVVFMLPSVAEQSELTAEDIWQWYPMKATVERAELDVMVAAVSGYFLRSSCLPVPKNIPHLRSFQRAQGIAALNWLRARNVLPE